MRSLTTDRGKIMYFSETGTVGQLRNLRKWALPAWQCPTALFNTRHRAEKLFSLVIEEVMGTVMWRNVFNHSRSQQFTEEAGSEYDDADEYTLVRWLNRGAALSRLFHLGNGIDIFTMKHGKTVPWLSDWKWDMAVAFTVPATNLDWNQYVLSASESSTSPTNWQTPRNKLGVIIQQFQKQFSSRYRDFHKSVNNIRMFQNHFALDADHDAVQMQMVAKWTIKECDILNVAINKGSKQQVCVSLHENFVLKTSEKKMITEFGSTSANKRFRQWIFEKSSFFPSLLTIA